MKQASLPKQLNYKFCEDLIRLGGKNDGGYLVSESDVKNATVMLGFGINTDWDFEKDFARINPTPIVAFDASSNLKLFLKQSLRALFRLELVDALVKPLKYLSLLSFFSGKNELHEKFVGLDIGGIHISLRSVLNDFSDTKIFVKMDIEGSEYRCLNDLVIHQGKICGAVIEFHDVDLHIEKITDFVASFKLPIAHIHANNYAPIDQDGIPLAIEVTFSKYGSFSNSAPLLPHKFDATNNPNDEEIKLEFA